LQFNQEVTKLHGLAGYEEHPSGQNMVVAIMCYDGYNMEDGVILNKGSVERGLARSTYFRPVSAEELRYSGGLIDEISVPDKDVKGYRSEHDYRFLEGDGIVYPEAKLQEGNVIILMAKKSQRNLQNRRLLFKNHFQYLRRFLLKQQIKMKRLSIMLQ